ncbi:MAG: hypothetical protein WC859_03040 [Elusimicrobiota bacterium]|jgi:hypothetical protein
MNDLAHFFHIPVMGTGFTIDSPLKVARYGISSVISLVDDVLIEQMRRFLAEKAGEPYTEISEQEEDHRAHRITAYLNLLNHLIEKQVQTLRSAPFKPGSDLVLYFEMLPEGPRKHLYRRMLKTSDSAEKTRLQDELRRLATPGSIDVNIMTKLDRAVYRDGQPLGPEHSDAMSALRGFALSVVKSSIVFSAGLNTHLYSYASKFPDFLPDARGFLKKKIILKVSDFRSAAIQGKFLAKRGLWISEFRIESGLNCGGHAFATPGYLLGPILEEFRTQRKALSAELLATCNTALATQGHPTFPDMPSVRMTVQGGIGTAQEQELLRTYYEVDGTGWGTPFLLVPEVTNVDDEHLQKLMDATEKDVLLSNHSPLGVPFWILNNAASEESRRKRIQEGQPGSACPKGYLAFNSEYTKVPICTASRAYQRLKLKDLEEASGMTESDRAEAIEKVMNKTCICHDLGGGATIKNGIDLKATTSICCGPNIAYFNKIATLKQMVDHIYGRISLLAPGERPHMFIKELKIYVDHLKEESRNLSHAWTARAEEHLTQFKANLQEGIAHYRQFAEHLTDEKERFLEDLRNLQLLIDSITITPVPTVIPHPI